MAEPQRLRQRQWRRNQKVGRGGGGAGGAGVGEGVSSDAESNPFFAYLRLTPPGSLSPPFRQIQLARRSRHRHTPQSLRQGPRLPPTTATPPQSLWLQLRDPRHPFVITVRLACRISVARLVVSHSASFSAAAAVFSSTWPAHTPPPPAHPSRSHQTCQQSSLRITSRRHLYFIGRGRTCLVCPSSPALVQWGIQDWRVWRGSQISEISWIHSRVAAPKCSF